MQNGSRSGDQAPRRSNRRSAGTRCGRPISRLNDALQEFHRAVRAQLRAPDAEDVLHDDEFESIRLKALTMSQRSTQA
jgi:hypothetical protein